METQNSILTAEVKELNNYLKKLDACVAIVKNVNSKLVEQLVQAERQGRENSQFSGREFLELVGIPILVRCVRRDFS